MSSVNHLYPKIKEIYYDFSAEENKENDPVFSKELVIKLNGDGINTEMELDIWLVLLEN